MLRIHSIPDRNQSNLSVCNCCNGLLIHNYSAIPLLLLKNLIAGLYKKADFENLKVIDCDFSTKWSPNSTIFAMVRFPGGTKFVLCAESL